ncbi:MAG: phosphotransferase [Acidimicrobiales bacterium]
MEIGPFERHLPATTVERAASDQLEHWAAVFERQRLEPLPGPRARDRVVAGAPAGHAARGRGAWRPPLGNLLHDGDRLTALLDWEMVHLGDPNEDLGWVYRDLWTPAALPFEAFLDAYEAAAARPVDRTALRWWQVFSELKHSVISLTAAIVADGATSGPCAMPTARRRYRASCVGPSS